MTIVRHFDFSFIILTFNSERYIAACLQSLNETVDAMQVSAQVFIIDNGSVDRTRQIIAAHEFSELIAFELIAYPHNTGTTFSRNQGSAFNGKEYNELKPKFLNKLHSTCHHVHVLK